MERSSRNLLVLVVCLVLYSVGCGPVSFPGQVVQGGSLILPIHGENQLGEEPLTLGSFYGAGLGSVGYGGTELLDRGVWDDVRGWIVLRLTDTEDSELTYEIPARVTGRVGTDPASFMGTHNGVAETIFGIYTGYSHNTVQVLSVFDMVLPNGDDVPAGTYYIGLVNRVRTSASQTSLDCDYELETPLCEDAGYDVQGPYGPVPGAPAYEIEILEDDQGTNEGPTDLSARQNEYLEAASYPLPKINLTFWKVVGDEPPEPVHGPDAAHFVVTYPTSLVQEITNVYADHSPKGDSTVIWKDDGSGTLTIDLVNPSKMTWTVAVAFNPVPRDFSIPRVAASDFTLVTQTYYDENGDPLVPWSGEINDSIR